MKKLIIPFIFFASNYAAQLDIDEIAKAINAVPANLTDNLPEEFRQQPEIKYIGAFRQQDGFSCGYWTLLNAKAIGYLLSKNTPLDHKTISAEAIRHRIYYRNLPDIEDIEIQNYSGNKEQVALGNLANNDELSFTSQIITLTNIHFLGYFGDSNRIMPHMESDAVYNMTGDGAILTDDRADQYYDSIIESSKNQNQQSNSIHFSCNQGGHWILISFIKEQNSKYMLILDSANGNLTGKKDFIELLYNIFLTKFVPNF